MSLRYEDHTEILRRCFFDVQNEVGLGRNEEDYHPACKLWFAEQGLPVVSKPPLRMMLDGEEAHVLFPDFVAWDAITVELKAVPRGLSSSEFVQLFNYLKFRRDRLGLLVNLGLDRVHVERIVFDPSSPRLIEDWSYWKGELDGHRRELGLTIRAALLAVYEAHGTGYGLEVVERLVLFSLQRRGLSVTVRPIAGAGFRGHSLPESPLDCFVIADTFVLTLTALFENNDFNMNRARSYMRALGLRWGIAANFGRSEACFTALRQGRNPRIGTLTPTAIRGFTSLLNARPLQMPRRGFHQSRVVAFGLIAAGFN